METETFTNGEYDLAEAHVEQRTSTTIVSVAAVKRDTNFEDEKSNTQLKVPAPNKSDETIWHIFVFSVTPVAELYIRKSNMLARTKGTLMAATCTKADDSIDALATPVDAEAVISPAMGG